MSSTKFIIGGVVVIAAFAATIPLFFKDYKATSHDDALSQIAVANASSAKTSSPFTLSKDTTLGTYNNKPLLYSDLTGQENRSLFEAQNQLYSAVEGALAKRFIDDKIKEYMAAKKITDTQTAERLFVQENVKISDKQVNDFIKKNADNPQLKGKTHDQQTALVRPYLMQQGANNYFRDLVSAASNSGFIKVSVVEKPVRPKIEVDIKNAHIKGDEKAPITLVEFADFQCPYCYQALPKISETMEKYPGKIKFVFKNFPLPFHSQAMNAAIAAECAAQQNKYWEMHDAIFEKYAKLADDLYPKLAKDLKLNIDKYNTCVKDPSIKSEIEKEIAYGSSIGVAGTPAFFINGTQVNPSVSEFSAAIDSELKIR